MGTTYDVAVVGGTGAMGGLIAARLSAIGRRVVIVGRNPATTAAITASGLTLEAADETVVVQPAATTVSSEIGPVGTVVVFVKGPQTPEVADALAPLVGPETTVVSLQNGLGNADVLARAVKPECLVMGVTYDGATLTAPGRVAHTGRGRSFVGPYVAGSGLERAEGIAALLAEAGFESLATASVMTEIWRKLIHNSACLPVAALTGLRNADLVAPGPVADLVDALAVEATNVGRALGHEIDPAERIDMIHTVLGRAGAGVVSMLADVRARRPTEIDTINGAVARAASEAGLDVPRHHAVIALVRGLELSWAKPPLA